MSRIAPTLAPEPALSPTLLGQMLLAEGLLEADDLERALGFQRTYGGRLGGILVRFGALAEDRLLGVLSRQLALPVATQDMIPPMPVVLETVERSGYPVGWWVDQEALVWGEDDGMLLGVARDPLSPSLNEFLDLAFDAAPIAWHLIANPDLDRALEQLQAAGSSPIGWRDEERHLREMAEEAPVVELVQSLLAQAFNERASDIHIEPEERSFTVRFRIDGVLQSRLTLARERFDAIASRIKLISGLDIAERRLPQDGRLSARLSGEEIDLRVSSLPGTWGESLVLRLLPKRRKGFDLPSLGMAPADLKRWRGVVGEPHGITLITGPTGSGKSTTLYATLEEIKDGTAKIVTVEEPVEYNIPGVTQVQTQSEIGYSFARALRAILRQDPDKIMVGEIRDLETAQIAVQAALTGHMVFSTLHTNDAVSSFTRLTEMGIEPFLVASSVRAVMAQRLVRRLCPVCAESEQAPEIGIDITRLARSAGLDTSVPASFKRAVGCPACLGLGYKGRLGIYEVVVVSPTIHDAILRQAPTPELAHIAAHEDGRTLREDGLVKAWAGQTSVDEVLRVTGLGSGATVGEAA